MRRKTQTTEAEQMEEPCMCECGNLFDLQDGYLSNKLEPKHLICKSCYENEIEEYWEDEEE